MVLTRSTSAAGKRRFHHVSLPYAPSRKRSKVGSASRIKEPAPPLSDPIAHDTANESDLIVTAQEGNDEPHDPVEEKLKEEIWKTTISPGDIEVSFENFPYYLSETTKNALISSAYVSLKYPNFTKRTSKLAAVSPRILLSGYSNCEIYKETLIKALAKYFDARLLILDLSSVCDCDSYRSEKLVENEQPNLQENKEASTETPSSTRPSHPMDFLIHESSSSGTEAGPLIIYMKRTGQSCLQIARETFKALEAAVEDFRKNTLLIGSYIQISGAEKPKLGGFQFLMTGSNSTVTTHLKNCSVCSQETAEETLNLLNELKKLFPHEMSIQRPQDDTLLGAWKKQLASDAEIINARSNVASIRSVLHKNGMDCVELEKICVIDHILARDTVEQIVGWATSHHLRHNPDASHDEDKIVVSWESIQHALNIVQDMKNEKKGVKKSIKDVVTGNEFEKKILDDVIPPKDIGVQFDDIGSLEEVKRTLKELVMLPLQRPELFSKGKLAKACKGILLFGPPGTGKTMLAKAVATESGANFINVSMPAINSKWIGEGEKGVKALFTLARKLTPAIIFIDEVDSLLGRRKSSGEHEENRKMKNEFMTNWDGLGTKENERILVLAATNRPFDLDEAVIRRLPRRVMVNLPDAQNREKILKLLLAKEEMSPDVDLHAIANMTEGYSGSDLKNLCIAAAHSPIRELIENEEKNKNLALAENQAAPDPYGSKDVRPLNMDDLKSAHQQVCASVSSHSSNMNELNNWNELYGEGGTRKQQKQLSYYI